MTRKTAITEFGDFQTPASLAEAVCRLLHRNGIRPKSLLEPTCGYGNLLFAAMDQFPGIVQSLGADINPKHVQAAQGRLTCRKAISRANVEQRDFFEADWSKVLAKMPEPILVIGNPPWVTSAGLGAIGGRNLPAKSNFQNHNGLDAITGKANFDISEWMLLRLAESLNGRAGTLAMLCKSGVARKVLLHSWKSRFAVEMAAVYLIDAQWHFDAAVDAVLLVVEFGPNRGPTEAAVHSSLTKETPERAFGCEDGAIVADARAYRRWKHLCGDSPLKWRSGVKHDCARVMELRREGAKWRNGLGELIELEDNYLYPVLKSSDVAKGRATRADRWMLIPQRSIGEDTAGIEVSAPKTWAYLSAHADLLNLRSSSIYRGRPPFSVFGVGDYTFAPWKVAISGFYKKLSFLVVGPVGQKPTVLDDTVYFLPFESKKQADFVAGLLNSPTAQEFFHAFVFWDSKRPVTVDLLRRLDLRKLADEIGSQGRFVDLFGDFAVGQKCRQPELFT